MPRKARVVERGLLAKGFAVASSRHRRFEYITLDGRVARAHTVMSHGSRREIGDGLLGEMARQLALTRRQFNDLIDCPLSRVEYEHILAERGLMPR